MNKSYKSIYNESTGTFVAVAENVKARGKRSSSRVRAAAGLAIVAASATLMGSALAAVEIDDLNDTITFTGASGTITGVTEIVGLTDLTLSGTLNANQIEVGGVSVALSTDITALDGRVDTNESAITSLGSRVGTAETDITGLDGRVGDNEAAITTINTSLDTLGVDSDNPGVKYFRANSAAADAQANGAESVAVGPRSVAGGARSVAAGDDARANGNNSVAVGAATRATGVNSTAVGNAAGATGARAIGVGSQAAAGGADAVSVGTQATANGLAAIALGNTTSAAGSNAVAIGGNASAAGAVGIAIGSGALAAAENNVSIGEGAGIGTVGNLANDWRNNVAIGTRAGQRVEGQRNVAMGSNAGNDTAGNDNIAFGETAGSNLTGDANISIGRNANSLLANVDRAIGIGQDARAGTDGIAIGHAALADGINGVALGLSANTRGSGVGVGRDTSADSGFVALGAGSRAVAADVFGNGYLTDRSFNGGAVSVGSSDAGNPFTRRIVNVEDGANDTDAVNVRQLKNVVAGTIVDYDELATRIGDNWGEQIAANKPKYLAINDGGASLDNIDNNGASGVRSIALGVEASTAAIATNATAIGSDVDANATSAVAIGHDVKALGANSTVIGSDRSEARDASGVAIGNIARSRGASSIVIGTNSEVDDQDGTTVDNSIVIGTDSISTAREGIVIGRDSLVNAARGMAQGDNAEATAVDAMAIGTGSRASGIRSQAQGTDAQAAGTDAIAIGTASRATQARAIAQGQDAQATAADAMAFGTASRASGASAQASGTGANASGANSQARGTGANASGANAQASGTNASASGSAAQASGNGATATGTNSIAIGTGASALANNASAFGEGAQAGHTASVALGSGAVTSAAVGTASMTVDKNTYNFAGTVPVATVSVGSVGSERTITHVAAGRISATSTDAINGSQLYGTNVAVNLLANNLDTAGTSVATLLGGNASYSPTTHQVTMSNVGNTGEGTVHDAIEYAAQGWDISANGVAGENVAPGGSVDFSSSDNNIVIARDGTDMDFALADDIMVDSVAINGRSGQDGLTIVSGDGAAGVGGAGSMTRVIYTDEGGNEREVATMDDGLVFAGNTGTDIAKKLGETVTISGELDAAADVTGANLRVDSENGQLNLVMAQDLTDLNSITITGGPVLSSSGIDMNSGRISNLAPGVDGTDAVNVDQLEAVEEIANTGWNLTDADGNDVNIAPGRTVAFTGDANIAVEQTGTTDGQIQIALARDLDVDSVTAGDSVLDTDGLLVDDGAGNSTSVGSDGLEVINALGTTTIGGTQIVIGGSNSITIDGDAGTIMGLSNRTWDPEGPIVNGRAATEDQLMLVSQTANAGWNVSVGGEGALADNKVAPNGVVDFSNTDGNIAITRNGTDLEFNLQKDIDLGSDGSLTTGNALVNNDGLTVDDGTGNVTTTTATGTTITDSAGNETKTNAAGTTIIDGAGNETTVAATGTTIVNDSGASTEVTAGTISLADANGTTTIGSNSITVAGGTNTITISGDTGTIGGLTNTSWDPDNFTSGQAATEDQLKAVNDVANEGWNLTDADGNLTNIGPGGTVTFEGDSNISVAQSGSEDDGTVEITLNEDIDLGATGSVTIGDTVVNNSGVAVGNDVELGSTGLVIAGGPSITTGGINAGGMVITNVAPGVNNTDAVNYGQLRPISEFLDLDASGTFAYNGGQHSTLKDALDSMQWNVEVPAPGDTGGDTGAGTGGTGGSGGSGSGGTGGGSGGGSGTTPIGNSNTLGFVEGDNVVISKTDRYNDSGERVGADIQVAMSQDVRVNSITAVNVQADEIQISNGGPIINEQGIDMSGKAITNVRAGVNETDAVNLGQLQQAAGNLQGQVNNLRNDVRRLDNKLSAGVAAAMATAALPQAYLPGKNMMAMAGGTWNGESGMAIGFSGITDNGKWVYKLSGNATSRGDYGGAVGVGYQW